jgi:hypothetical protein
MLELLFISAPFKDGLETFSAYPEVNRQVYLVPCLLVEA